MAVLHEALLDTAAGPYLHVEGPTVMSVYGLELQDMSTNQASHNHQRACSCCPLFLEIYTRDIFGLSIDWLIQRSRGRS